MKQLIVFLLSLLPLIGWAQDDEWPHDWPSPFRPDTVGKVPCINNYGDPFSGVHLYFEEVDSATKAMYIYQCDENVRPVKQIVVLNQQYADAPADLQDSTFTHENKEYRVRGALRVAAVTDREYMVFERAGLIWGDAFSYYKGFDAFENDSIRTNAFLIFVRKKGHEADKEIMPDNALEIMYFDAISAETGKPINVMCAAPCKGVNQGNYKYWIARNREKGYSSPSNWISRDEYERWINRLGWTIEKPKKKRSE